MRRFQHELQHISHYVIRETQTQGRVKYHFISTERAVIHEKQKIINIRETCTWLEGEKLGSQLRQFDSFFHMQCHYFIAKQFTHILERLEKRCCWLSKSRPKGYLVKFLPPTCGSAGRWWSFRMQSLVKCHLEYICVVDIRTSALFQFSPCFHHAMGKHHRPRPLALLCPTTSGLKQQSQVAMNWKLWECDPKYSLPPLK